MYMYIYFILSHIACRNATFGDKCAQVCKCLEDNTLVCHHVTGDCKCKEGWTGDICSEDIDECKRGSVKCDKTLHQECVNTEGSAYCRCQYGQNTTGCIGIFYTFYYNDQYSIDRRGGLLVKRSPRMRESCSDPRSGQTLVVKAGSDSPIAKF